MNNRIATAVSKMGKAILTDLTNKIILIDKINL